jgi:hypothetical protein
MEMAKKVFMIAGEVSGDVNASHLARAMRRLDPSLEFVGIGGGNMRDAGVRLLADLLPPASGHKPDQRSFRRASRKASGSPWCIFSLR